MQLPSSTQSWFACALLNLQFLEHLIPSRSLAKFLITPIGGPIPNRARQVKNFYVFRSLSEYTPRLAPLFSSSPPVGPPPEKRELRPFGDASRILRVYSESPLWIPSQNHDCFGLSDAKKSLVLLCFPIYGGTALRWPPLSGRPVAIPDISRKTVCPSTIFASLILSPWEGDQS